MSKNSSETVPDCFLSRPSLNISYCQSGPQPTLMTGEAAQGGHTDTHTQVQPPPVASHANTYRDSIIVLLIKKGGIYLNENNATGGSNKKKKRGWHAKQKQYNKDVKAIIMQFSLGMMHFVIISK